MKQYVCTISISPERKKKYDLAKLKESWSQKMNLTDDDFMYLLLEGYPNPPKDKD